MMQTSQFQSAYASEHSNENDQQKRLKINSQEFRGGVTEYQFNDGKLQKFSRGQIPVLGKKAEPVLSTKTSYQTLQNKGFQGKKITMINVHGAKAVVSKQKIKNQLDLNNGSVSMSNATEILTLPDAVARHMVTEQSSNKLPVEDQNSLQQQRNNVPRSEFETHMSATSTTSIQRPKRQISGTYQLDQTVSLSLRSQPLVNEQINTNNPPQYVQSLAAATNQQPRVGARQPALRANLKEIMHHTAELPLRQVPSHQNIPLQTHKNLTTTMKTNSQLHMGKSQSSDTKCSPYWNTREVFQHRNSLFQQPPQSNMSAAPSMEMNTAGAAPRSVKFQPVLGKKSLESVLFDENYHRFVNSKANPETLARSGRALPLKSNSPQTKNNSAVEEQRINVAAPEMNCQDKANQ